jgi:hypothetical protein
MNDIRLIVFIVLGFSSLIGTLVYSLFLDMRDIDWEIVLEPDVGMYNE